MEKDKVIIGKWENTEKEVPFKLLTTYCEHGFCPCCQSDVDAIYMRSGIHTIYYCRYCGHLEITEYDENDERCIEIEFEGHPVELAEEDWVYAMCDMRKIFTELVKKYPQIAYCKSGEWEIEEWESSETILKNENDRLKKITELIKKTNPLFYELVLRDPSITTTEK